MALRLDVKEGARGVPDPEHLTQFELMQARVAYVLERSEFYRQRARASGFDFGGCRSLEDFGSFPMVTKSQLIDDQAAHPPYGSLFVSAGRLVRVFCSGGTMLLAFTETDLAALESMYAGMLQLAGVRAGDLVDVASSFHWVAGGTVFDGAFRRLGAGVIPSGPGLSDLRIDVLTKTGVTVLQAFTPYAESLGERIQQRIGNRADHKVRLLIVGGELRTADAKRRISELWNGADVRDTYGASEVGLAAVECERSEGMHVSPHCYVEVIDPVTGREVSAGTAGEVVMTETYRSAQPMVRFRSGDITQGLLTDPCACGLPGPRLGRIIGRVSDVLRVRGQFISEALMRKCLDRFTNIGGWRVVVDRPTMRDSLVLELSAAAGGELLEQDLRDIAAALRSHTALSFEIVRLELPLVDAVTWYEDRRHIHESGS
jgi:phenylacetate-coenzyme A ligase PaaK-like adenylate-forming protein